ncbi:hypothetical protein [Blastopirellula marina]|uniref:Uncharacterized protein n=1 Tax=Blastopirellula marina TaxID=124 RepID=A0A2S8F319_9BACT|nr:hypothetical protein [Blastopirellula marina]PQO26550.1 hypothetical protein C5Y98_29625 [Blastopirellula marina]PTL40861.1 hypothetical protein C5Y97_29640 [Blastopirellula marina]
MPESDNEESIFGGKACIAIRYEGTLDQLASTIEEALNLKAVTIETNEEPPHQRVASAESMGWEMWLEENSSVPPYNYRLRIETEHSLRESFEDRMFDLSPWFARLVTSLCDVKAYPVESP